MSIILSEAQAEAIAVIRDWYRNHRHVQQVLRVFGYAGTGKTTITREAIQALGLEPMTPGGLGGVLFAAFTGKAVLVMTRKGTPAQTMVVSRMLWKFPGGALRASDGSLFQAARSRGMGSMG